MANLIEPQPPVLPEIFLPVNNNKNVHIGEWKRSNTNEELKIELEAARLKYAPFMFDLAPEHKTQKTRTYISEFKWRIEKPGDLIQFPMVLEGGGSWEIVNIPHYGEPLGRATTYYFKEVELKKPVVSDQALFICFGGVDYIAEVFINGNFVGSHEGFFAPFEFEISKLIVPGKNKIFIKVRNDFPTTQVKDASGNKVVGDKIYAATGPGYDDPLIGWHHGPAGMGIYQDCFLEWRNELHISDVFIRPLCESKKAEAWVEINNYNSYPKKIRLQLSVFGQNFRDTVVENLEYIPQTVYIPGAGDLAKPVDWQLSELPMGYGVNYLRIPLDMGDFRYWNPSVPWLYQLQIKLFDENGNLLDTEKQQFGMRSFTTDTLSAPKGRMFLNGQQIRLRGANTMGNMQQCVIKKDFDQLRDDILLAKLCNINYLRLTQRTVQPEIYEYCDKLGMLNQSDLPLFGSIRRNKFAEVVKQAEEMERLVRKHPSTIMVSYINERFPNAEGNPQRSLSTREEYYRLFAALDQAVLLSNPDRVIKAGDGDYDPPTPGLPDSHCYNIWYNGHGLGLGKMYKGYWQPVKPDWLYACGEFGAEGLDPLNVMYKYYPKEWLPKDKEDEKNWTANRISMAQTHRFHYMWYNTQHSLSEWIEASQDYQAEAVKFVTESFRRDSRMVSFAIHLFIDAWPAGWMKTIMDVDRQPKKAYFAYRDALEPLMLSLRCDRNRYFPGEDAAIEVWICNDENTVPQAYKVNYQLEQDGEIVFKNEIDANIPVNSSQFQGFIKYKIPDVTKRTLYLFKAALMDKIGICTYQNTFEIEVFPNLLKSVKKVFIVGDENGLAGRLASDSQLEVIDKPELADVILIDDFERFKQIENKVNELVKSGKTAVFLEIPAQKYSIANTIVTVEKTVMGDYYFVSPQSGHQMTKDFKAFDFRMWYNKSAGYITPILSNTFSSPEWLPILTSGASNWISDKGVVMAAGELKFGKGFYRICELQLSGRTDENPAALLFFRQLINEKN